MLVPTTGWADDIVATALLTDACRCLLPLQSALASGSEQSDSEKNPVFSMSHRVCVYPLVPTSEAGEGQAAVLAPVGVPIAAPRVSAKSDDGQGPTGDAPTLRAYEVFENERRQPFR